MAKPFGWINMSQEPGGVTDRSFQLSGDIFFYDDR